MVDCNCCNDADSMILEVPRLSKLVAQASRIPWWLVVMLPSTDNLVPCGVTLPGERNLLFAFFRKFWSICSDCSLFFLALRRFILTRTFFLSRFFFSRMLPDRGLPAFLHSFQLDLLFCKFVLVGDRCKTRG